MFDQQLLTLFAVWLLAFARILLIMVQAPIWGSKHYNNQVRIGTAAVLTTAVFPTIPVPDHLPLEAREYIGCVLTQVAVGLAIGFISFMVLAAAQFGGEMLDIQLGLSVAASADPSSHGAINLIRRLHFYLAMQLYLLLDGHHDFMAAIWRSFETIPVTHFQLPGPMVEGMARSAGDVFLVGVQIAAPALAALFIGQIALGLLARVAPQMNVFMLSFPMNIGIGLTLLTVGLPFVCRLLEQQFIVNMDQTMQVIKHLSP
ncbi:MAG: flagellar biosynthetic protein FliR [Candidatus Eremiobacterota bacterium]